MSRSSRVLLLGSRGLLGSHLAVALRDRGVGSILEHSAPRFNREDEIREYILNHNPTTVVNCIGYTGPEAAEHDRVNGRFPRVMGDCCHSLGALFIHVSTNAVFAPDEERLWLPSDPVAPRTPYEVSKVSGEDPRAYIIRASFIGASPKGVGIYDRLRQGLPFVDRRWNGVTADTLARHITDVIVERDGIPSSILEHVHSPRVTRFRDIGRMLRSASRAAEENKDARLLGGGKPLPDLEEQLNGYVRWIAESRGVHHRDPVP